MGPASHRLLEQPEMCRWGQACLSGWEGVLGHVLPRLLTPCCVFLNVSPHLQQNSIPVSSAGFCKMGWWVKIKDRLHESVPREEVINGFNPHKTLKSMRLQILTAGKALVNSHTGNRNSTHTTHSCRNQAPSVPHISKLFIIHCASQDLLSPAPRPVLRVGLGVMNPQLPFLPLPQ